MTATPALGLPLIAAQQAQKHVTHNEALLALDALVQLCVLDRDLAAPPGTGADGDRYIVAGLGTGAWAGQGGKVAVRLDGAWRFFAPLKGWLAYLADEGALVAWNGTAWVDAIAAIGPLQNVPRLGLATTADAANPLSARLNGALLTARPVGEGGTGDLRLAINKEDAAKTASLLFQDAFAGRAEIGLLGDDDFSFKVSADGTVWTEAWRVDRASGAVSFPAGAVVTAGLRNRILNGGFMINQRNYASGAALAANAYGFDRWKAGTSGCTMTFSVGTPDVTVTITAGSLRQIVEAREVEGGAYILSWSGSAQGRVNGGAYAASPIRIAALPANTAITVEFTGGTLARVQFEPGRAATPFERRGALELPLCQRYFAAVGHTHAFVSGAAGAVNHAGRPLPIAMRATPTVTRAATSSTNGTLASTAFGPDFLRSTLTATASGLSEWTGTLSCDAEL
ncbi:MAG TPA: DUF2793 domain-containing protein [Beijerinckiaceae bacterium]|jgi:hypothetical protein